MTLYQVKSSHGEVIGYLKKASTNASTTYKRSEIETSIANELLRRYDWKIDSTEAFLERSDGLMRIPLSFLETRNDN